MLQTLALGSQPNVKHEKEVGWKNVLKFKRNTPRLKECFKIQTQYPKVARMSSNTFKWSFSLWELETHDVMNFLDKSVNNKLQIKPFLDCWNCLLSANIENEFSFYI
jgi:hypothetical protein